MCPVSSTLSGFLVLRGIVEQSNPSWAGTWKGFVVPFGLVAAPVLGFQLAKKVPAPEAYQIALIYCVLQHTYDRYVAVQHYNGWKGKLN